MEIFLFRKYFWEFGWKWEKKIIFWNHHFSPSKNFVLKIILSSKYKQLLLIFFSSWIVKEILRFLSNLFRKENLSNFWGKWQVLFWHLKMSIFWKKIWKPLKIHRRDISPKIENMACKIFQQNSKQTNKKMEKSRKKFLVTFNFGNFLSTLIFRISWGRRSILQKVQLRPPGPQTWRWPESCIFFCDPLIRSPHQ